MFFMRPLPRFPPGYTLEGYGVFTRLRNFPLLSKAGVSFFPLPHSALSLVVSFLVTGRVAADLLDLVSSTKILICPGCGNFSVARRMFQPFDSQGGPFVFPVPWTSCFAEVAMALYIADRRFYSGHPRFLESLSDLTLRVVASSLLSNRPCFLLDMTDFLHYLSFGRPFFFLLSPQLADIPPWLSFPRDFFGHPKWKRKPDPHGPLCFPWIPPVRSYRSWS